MKNKRLTYLLAFVVLSIWGLALTRLRNEVGTDRGLYGKEPESTLPDRFLPFALPDSIKSPFKPHRARRVVKKKHGKPASLPQKPPPSTVAIPPFRGQFFGSVGDPSDPKRYKAIVRISDKTGSFLVGDTLSDVWVVRLVSADSLTLRSVDNKQVHVVRK